MAYSTRSTKSSRRYTNMNTIFEKIKMGEITATPQRKLFANLDYKKKAELIKPYLHPIDSFGIKRSLDESYRTVHGSSNLNDIKNLIHRAQAANIIRKPPTSSEQQHLFNKISDIYNKIPPEIFSDIFNQYYTNIRNLKYEDRGANNKNRFRMVDKANDPVIKIITAGSNVKSLLFTKSMIEYFMIMLLKMEEQDPEEFQKFMQNLKGNKGNNSQDDQSEGEGDGEEGDDADQNGNPNSNPNNKSKKAGKGNTDSGDYSSQLEKILKQFTDSPNQAADSFYQNQMDQAKKTLDDIQAGLSEDELKKIWASITKGNMSEMQNSVKKLNPEHAKTLRDNLANIGMNLSNLKSTIKKLLDSSISFFSAKERVTFDQFIDNPMIDEIQDYLYLHPTLRKVCLDDLVVKETERKGKIDVYIDVSGSMGSSANIKGNRSMSRLTFAKSLALKLKEMDMLNDVYSFQQRISKEGNTVSDIVFIDGNGGTNLNAVVEQIEKSGRNALVITDAEDRVVTYSDKVFFIGVAGSDFTSFDNNALIQYAHKKQMIVFDGTKIMTVDSAGRTA